MARAIGRRRGWCLGEALPRHPHSLGWRGSPDSPGVPGAVRPREGGVPGGLPAFRAPYGAGAVILGREVGR